MTLTPCIPALYQGLDMLRTMKIKHKNGSATIPINNRLKDGAWMKAFCECFFGKTVKNNHKENPIDDITFHTHDGRVFNAKMYKDEIIVDLTMDESLFGKLEKASAAEGLTPRPATPYDYSMYELDRSEFNKRMKIMEQVIREDERELCKGKITSMYKIKYQSPEQGVTFGYNPVLSDYLDAI